MSNVKLNDIYTGVNYLKILSEIMTVKEIDELLEKKGLSHLKGKELQEAIAKEIEEIIQKNEAI